MDTKQVAILVPTTILAEQHYYTFKERLKGYPVVIEMLSRFRFPKEQKSIIKKIEDGEVDIVIGTHRLLSKDIKFRDLGLLIIDEEHRFGVAHKERIKQMRKMVDVLTMTATPIPRTLHMALIGTRDMSIIDTPPEGRLPIQTEVVEFNNDVIADAILREIDRGGQVFFVHNRVQSIDSMANFIKELVPQVRVATAHGQMPPAKLEKIMYDFVHNKYDILISTSIIESGLDIPKVNTMIINRADRFGLAQLYQLRGRIGRSTRRAYAYLLIPSGRILSQEAHKRLKAMEEYTDLGSGLRIAMRDLEIRGAGDILGAEQHGHMLSVGFDLYCQILKDAIREIKGEEEERKIETTIKAYFDSYIPDTYIAEQGEKIIVYRKLSNIDRIEEIDKLKDELNDRFGKLPKPVLNLFEIVAIKLLSSKIGLEQITIKEKFALLEYPANTNVNFKDIEDKLKDYSKKIEFQTGNKIALKIRFPFENTVDEQSELIKKVLSLLT
jgi:transcription-repair coupling factor (superfamily II helicase)